MKSFNMEELMYQILSVLNEKNPRTQREIVTVLEDIFGLTEEERAEKTSSNQLKFYKTVAGAAQRLKKAGLVDFGIGKKGMHSITEEGKRKLASQKGVIEPTDLNRTNPSLPSKDVLSHYEKQNKNGCTMVTIPRDNFDRKIDIEILEEAPCLYVLTNGKKHYAGYSGNAFERIYNHSLKSKEPFPWTTAYVFTYSDISDGTHLDIADAAYLEYLVFQKADFSKMINFKTADPLYMKPNDKKKMDELFNTIKDLLYQTGCNLIKR